MQQTISENWSDIFRAAKSIEEYYRTILASSKDEKIHPKKSQLMVRELKWRSSRLMSIHDEQIDCLAKQIMGQVISKSGQVPISSKIFKILSWLGIQVQEFYIPPTSSSSDIVKLIISQFSDLKAEANYDAEYLQTYNEEDLQESSEDVQQLRLNGNQGQSRLPFHIQTIGIEQLRRKQLNSSKLLLHSSISNKQKRVIYQIRQNLKQPYYRFIKQFIKTCQKYLHYQIQMFGIYINYLLQSGSKDYVRKFITKNHQNSSISIGNQQYIIDQQFVDDLQIMKRDIECHDVWLKIIKQYLATIPFKKTQPLNFLYQLSSQIYKESIQVRELFSSYQNIEHLIQDLLPMIERKAKQKQKNSKFSTILRFDQMLICCHLIVQGMYQITSYDDYNSRWVNNNDLIEQLNQLSSTSKIEVFLLRRMPDQQTIFQSILEELHNSFKKRDKLYTYQTQKLKEKKTTKIEIPRDRNKRKVSNLTFKQFWEKVVQMNLTQISNLVQLTQRGIGNSEEVVCALVTTYNYLLNYRPDIIAQCFRTNKEKATLTFCTDNAKQQQYFEYFFDNHSYQIILKHGTEQETIKMAFQEMYQKMVLFLLEDNLTIYEKGYRASEVLKLLINGEYQHIRIYFSLNKQLVDNKISYKQIIAKILQTFIRQGETIASKFVLKHFDSHCCRLTSQNTQIRPQNIHRRQTALLSSQLSKYSQIMSISFIQIMDIIKEQYIKQQQILEQIYLFATSVSKQSLQQLEIHDSYEQNFYKIQITPRNAS